MATVINNFLLDTVAGAADSSVTGGILTIKADAGNYIYLPTQYIQHLGQSTYPVMAYLVEAAQVNTVTYTAAANTQFAFFVNQPTYNLYGYKSDVISLTTTSTNGTDAYIATQLTAEINRVFGSGITVSGAASPITLTGGTGFPVFDITAVSNVAVAAAQPTKAPNATPGTALAGTTTVTVTTAAAHGLANGNSVNITTATGYTFTRNGTATVAAISNARITVTGATTFTLDEVTGSGTNTGTIVITVVAQAARGTYAQVLANVGLTGTVGASYGLITITCPRLTNGGIGGALTGSVQYNLYVNATTSAANYVAYVTQIRDLLDNSISG